MAVYLLDTDHASYVIRGHANVLTRLRAVPPSSVCVSSLTAAELLLGVAKNPDATRLAQLVDDFLRHVNVLDWTMTTAEAFVKIRSKGERQGVNLPDFDALIAGHAYESGATLVTHDQAFNHFRAWLDIEDWTLAPS